MHVAIWVLCLTGIFLSLFSLSGTWLVVGGRHSGLFPARRTCPGDLDRVVFSGAGLINGSVGMGGRRLGCQ